MARCLRCGATDEWLEGNVHTDAEKCRWTEDWEGTWETACGRTMVYEYRIDEDKDHVYCCKCGRRIEYEVYRVWPIEAEVPEE